MMKKTIFILTALAALACTAISCRKEFAEMQPGATGFTVTATIAGGGTAENGTKVSATDDDHSLALKWQQGDKLIGFDDATPRNTYGFEVTSVDGGKATLTRIEDGDEDERGTATTDPADGTKMYMLYVPGNTVADLGPNFNPSEGILSYDLSTQDENALPVSMTAKGTVTDGKLDLTFKVQTAIIGIKSPTMVNNTTTSIILSSTTALNTKVTFSLDNNGDLKATYGSDSAGTITKTVNFTEKNPNKNTFIVVCPVTSAADLTFTSNNGEAFTKTGKTVAAGKYYYMTPEFVSMGREITVSFGDDTKSLFDVEPTFTTGQKIKVSNGTDAPEDCAITVTESTATIETKLTGELKLAYPAGAAEVDDKNIVGVNVPASQDGTPAGAIFATAEVTETGNTAVFNNQTSVFKISLPDLSTINKLEIKSLPPVNAGEVKREGTKGAINTGGLNAEAKSVITVSPTSGTFTSGSTIYVSLAPGVKLCDLAFDATTGTYTGTMAGIPGSVIATQDVTTEGKTKANTLYTVNDFHEYVNVDGVKWAKTNIGATKETGRGKYFAWAETVGREIMSSISIDATKTSISGAFSTNFKKAVGNTPYLKKDGTTSYSTTVSYTKYISSDSKTSLDLMDDAAYYNWGGPWSMPTSNDYTNLYTKATEKAMDQTTEGINITDSPYGYKFTVSGESIFFPAAGYGDDLVLKEIGTSANPNSSTKTINSVCYYWSKTLSSSTDNSFIFSASVKKEYNKSKPFDPKITLQEAANMEKARYYGMPIRPVSTY